jgi:hypothetical protein
MDFSWDLLVDVLATIGNLGIYLLWGVGMVFALRLMKE